MCRLRSFLVPCVTTTTSQVAMVRGHVDKHSASSQIAKLPISGLNSDRVRKPSTSHTYLSLRNLIMNTLRQIKSDTFG